MLPLESSLHPLPGAFLFKNLLDFPLSRNHPRTFQGCQPGSSPLLQAGSRHALHVLSTLVLQSQEASSGGLTETQTLSPQRGLPWPFLRCPLQSHAHLRMFLLRCHRSSEPCLPITFSAEPSSVSLMFKSSSPSERPCC